MVRRPGGGGGLARPGASRQAAQRRPGGGQSPAAGHRRDLLHRPGRAQAGGAHRPALQVHPPPGGHGGAGRRIRPGAAGGAVVPQRGAQRRAVRRHVRQRHRRLHSASLPRAEHRPGADAGRRDDHQDRRLRRARSRRYQPQGGGAAADGHLPDAGVRGAAVPRRPAPRQPVHLPARPRQRAGQIVAGWAAVLPDLHRLRHDRQPDAAARRGHGGHDGRHCYPRRAQADQELWRAGLPDAGRRHRPAGTGDQSGVRSGLGHEHGRDRQRRLRPDGEHRHRV